jgi:T5orf172 domain
MSNVRPHNAMRAYVYILSNPAFPGLLKVGWTTDTPENRIRQLHTTGVPSPFVLEAALLVHQAEETERQVHQALAGRRHAQNREFFDVPFLEALDCLTRVVLTKLAEAETSEESSASALASSNHGLPPSELLLLRLLVSSGIGFGMTEYQLKEQTSFSELDIQIHLSGLAAKKLVSMKPQTANSYSPVWRCTPKGTKHLADHALVEPWMYER